MFPSLVLSLSVRTRLWKVLPRFFLLSPVTRTNTWFLPRTSSTSGLTGSEGSEWKEIYEEEIENSRRMFENCVNEEKAWAKYLFKDGSMIGLSENLLSNYVEWIANRSMKAIGLKPLYSIPAKNNPLP